MNMLMLIDAPVIIMPWFILEIIGETYSFGPDETQNKNRWKINIKN